MGILTWLGAAIAAFILARIFSIGRFHPVAELVIAIVSALTAGLIATWLDFGGYAEPDWRAAVFAGLTALTSIALTRIAIVSLKVGNESEDQEPM